MFLYLISSHLGGAQNGQRVSSSNVINALLELS